MGKLNGEPVRPAEVAVFLPLAPKSHKVFHDHSVESIRRLCPIQNYDPIALSLSQLKIGGSNTLEESVATRFHSVSFRRFSARSTMDRDRHCEVNQVCSIRDQPVRYMEVEVVEPCRVRQAATSTLVRGRRIVEAITDNHRSSTEGRLDGLPDKLSARRGEKEQFRKG